MLQINSLYFCILFIFAFTSCSTLTNQEIDSSYIIIEAQPNATITPTPFQPGNRVEAGEIEKTSQSAFPAISSSTPFPILSVANNVVQFPMTTPQALPIVNSGDNISILLLGSDSRSGASFRTDTIIIAILIPSAGQVSLISFPRDLWVNIPEIGMQRINTAYQYGEMNGYSGGGAGLLKDTISYNFGMNIDFTVLVDFDGFRKSIDTIGGIDLPISCAYTDWKLIDNALDPQNEDNWFLYTAGPGILHMDGDLSLWYARSRKHSNDFDRGRRQQEVLRGIFASLLKYDLLPKIPDLYTNLLSSYTTDIKLDDLLRFLPVSLKMSNPYIRSYFIAGDMVTPWITPGGANVLLPNNDPIQQMITTAVGVSQVNTDRIQTKIEIQNGTSMVGWDKLAAERLNYAGFSTIYQPADNTEHLTTLLYDLSIEQDRAKSSGILALLGLPDTSLVSTPSQSSKTKYALIVGNDYNTCFKPSEISP